MRASILDGKLADIAAEASSSVIYLVGRDGVAIAASNAGTPQSFVGSDYGFRTYFAGAMADGSAQQYALGTVSGRPGLYLSRRVDSVMGPLGVVVVKVEFDDARGALARRAGWSSRSPIPTAWCCSPPTRAWRFGTTRPVADEAAARGGAAARTVRSSGCALTHRGAGRARIDGRPSTCRRRRRSAPRRPAGRSPSSCPPSRR